MKSIRTFLYIGLIVLSGCSMRNPVNCPDTIGSWNILVFPLHIHSELNDLDKTMALERATNRWNAIVGYPVFVMDNHGISVWYDGSLRSPVQANTRLKLNMGYIISATIVVNPNNDADFESLMLHELGHVLGLMHEKNGSDEVMSPYLLPNTERLNVDNWAIDRIQCLYK